MSYIVKSPSLTEMFDDIGEVWSNDKSPIAAVEEILDFLIPQVQSLEVNSARSLDGASRAYNEIRRFRLKVDEWKRGHKAHYDREARRLTEPLSDAEDALKEKMLSYESALRKSQEEEFQRACKFLGIDAPAPVVKSKTDAAGVGITTKKVQKIRITDEFLIPDAFWIVDEKAIKEVIKQGGNVPGIEIYEEEETTVRIK